MSDLAAELANLRSELQQAVDEPHLKAAAEAAKGAVSAAGEEFEAKLAELRELLADAGEDASALVTAHPLTSVGAAFFLGVMVGRMTGHR